MVNSKALFFDFLDRIPGYDGDEAKEIAYLVFGHVFGISQTHIISEKHINARPDQLLMLNEIVHRLNEHEPVQYVLGHGYFFGRKFFVNPDVLIPRPETEELVARVIDAAKSLSTSQPQILDIGTGSGCIPITLSLELPKAKITATDISDAALQGARKNAISLGATVDFQKHNILTEEIHLTGLEIIVSNPPYIAPEEKNDMRANVVDYEPHLALFSPPDDPLIFYKRIAEKSMRALTSNGYLIMEMNAFKAEEIKLIFEQAGFVKVELIRDLSDKLRVICGRKQTTTL